MDEWRRWRVSVDARLGALQTDVSALKGDVSTLKTDVSTLKTDVSTLKTDVSTLSASSDSLTASVRNGFIAMGNYIDKVRDQLRDEIRASHEDLREEIRSSRSEMMEVVDRAVRAALGQAPSLSAQGAALATLRTRVDDHEDRLRKIESRGAGRSGRTGATRPRRRNKGSASF